MWQPELCYAGAMAEDSGMTYEQMLGPGTEGRGRVMAKELRVGWPRGHPAPVGAGWD